MSVAGWIYDHAPKRVQDWMDNSMYQREADEHYAKEEAESIWGDRRKYNIEHGIPLTPEQQKQQNKIEQSDRPWVLTAEENAEEAAERGNFEPWDHLHPGEAERLSRTESDHFAALIAGRDYAKELALDQPRREAAMLRAEAEIESADTSTDRVGDGSDLPIGWQQIDADNPAVMTSFETPAQAMSAVRHNDRLHLHSAELQATLSQSKERGDDLGR